MTTIQVFPYVEPDKQVSAKHHPANLEEHLLAFLASNNQEGYLEVDFDDNVEIAQLLHDISKREYITPLEFRYAVLKLREGAPNLNDVQLGGIVARALGYDNEAHMRDKTLHVATYAKNAGVRENVIYSARFQLSVYRRRTVFRADKEAPRGTVGLFRAAIIDSSKVTEEEFKLLSPVFAEFFKKHMFRVSVRSQELKDDLNAIFLDENKRRRKDVKEGRATVLDTMYIILGYSTQIAAVQYQREHGTLVNRRQTEHMSHWKVK